MESLPPTIRHVDDIIYLNKSTFAIEREQSAQTRSAYTVSQKNVSEKPRLDPCHRNVNILYASKL